MLQSMTGFGSTSLKIDDLEINIELKTLNSRYFDSKISLPPCLSSQELHFNNILKVSTHSLQQPYKLQSE